MLVVPVASQCCSAIMLSVLEFIFQHLSRFAYLDGLHTAQNKEAKRHSVVHCHSAGKHCFVTTFAWKIRQNL